MLIAAGGRSCPNTGHSACVDEIGRVFCWGNGGSGKGHLQCVRHVFYLLFLHTIRNRLVDQKTGQLGLGGTVTVERPMLVGSLHREAIVVSGAACSRSRHVYTMCSDLCSETSS